MTRVGSVDGWKRRTERGRKTPEPVDFAVARGSGATDHTDLVVRQDRYRAGVQKILPGGDLRILCRFP